MAFNSQNGFGQPQPNSYFTTAQRRTDNRIDQQLNSLTSNLSSFDINNTTEARQFNPPPSRYNSQPKRNRSRFDPPIAPRADLHGDIELSGTRSRKNTAKETRRARESQRRQAIVNKPDDKFKVSKSSKKNSHKKQNRNQRRQEQKEALNLILADPERAERRAISLKRLYTAGQQFHLAESGKEALRAQLRELTEELAHDTEKTAIELYHDLCNTDVLKAAEVIINGDFSRGIAETAALNSALNDISTSAAASSIAKNSRKAKDLKRNAFLGIPTPKFNPKYTKTTHDAHEFKRIWKIARPLLSHLIIAAEEGNELNIARAYAPARQPTKELVKILRRTFEEILSEVVPSLTAAQISKFEAPFLEVEAASRPKEPELPDFGGLSLDFNDVLDSMSRPWGGAAVAAPAPTRAAGFSRLAQHHAAPTGDDDEEL